MRDECPHGQLRRQCEVCELIAERDALRARINDAPMATLAYGPDGDTLMVVSAEYARDWAGKTVRLVVES